MGKSMSTAKQANRSTITKVVTESATQQKSNPKESVRRVLPVSIEPSTAYLNKVNNLDTSFNDRLKQVFVTSVDKNPNLDLPKDRTMPKDRTTPYALTPHSQITDKRAPNSLLVDDLKMILVNYKLNPEKWTHEYIAARFDISSEIAEQLVTNYSSLETFYANAPSESDKYLHREDPVKKINPQTSILEMEEICADKTQKWKTKEQFMKEWKNSK